MNTFRQLKPVAWLISLLICFHPLKGLAEDIDIFVGSSAGAADNPNILIVLDNTSNWARQAQQWPGNEQQGQAEVDAIRTVINATGQVNVGLFSFNTDGTAGQKDGGKVRYHISTMDSTNKANLSTLLRTRHGSGAAIPVPA